MAEIQNQKLAAGLRGQLEQRQLLSQNLRRSLELLSLPVTGLESRLSAELESNPLLELPDFPEAPELLPSGNENIAGDENDYEANSVLAEEWSDELPLPQNISPEDEKRDFIGSLPAPPPPLRTELMVELSAMDLPEKLLLCAFEIISALNDDGFLEMPLADLAMVCDAEMPEMQEALELVQQIAPPGVAARDLPECLRLQLSRSGRLSAQMALLLDEGLEDLEKNRLDHLAVRLGTDIAGVKALLKTLRSLNPAPGRQSTPVNAVVVPDLTVIRQDDGRYRCVVNRGEFSRIAISPVYEKLLDDHSLSEDDRAYLTGKLASARELLRALSMRESTLKQLGDLLVGYQHDFFDRGIAALKPMTMKTAAGILNVSESTVSRCVADKFAETPQGTLPLKFFFSGGYDSGNGSEISSQAVMDKIRELISQEDSFSPLSDEMIVKLLKKSGISVARRTVAKYRELMKIPPSSLRKKFF